MICSIDWFLLNIQWVVFQLYSGSIIYKNYKNGEGMGQPGQWLNCHWKSMNIDEKNYSCNCYNTSALFQNRVEVRPVK